MTWTAFVSAPAFVFEFLYRAIAESLFSLPAISEPHRRIVSHLAPCELPRWRARPAFRLIAVVCHGGHPGAVPETAVKSPVCAAEAGPTTYTSRASSRAHAMGVYGGVRFCGVPRQPHLPRRNPGAGPEPTFRNPVRTPHAGPATCTPRARRFARTRWGCTVVYGFGTAPSGTMSRLRGRLNLVGG